MDEPLSNVAWNTPSRSVLEDLQAVQEYYERNCGYRPLTEAEQRAIRAIDSRLEQAFRDAEEKSNYWRLSEEDARFRMAVGLMTAAAVAIGLAIGLLGFNF